MRVFLVCLSALMVVTPVFGLSAADEEEFAQNDLLFYDPEGQDSYCATAYADCNIIGETKDEKLWSGLRHTGFTPKQTAAIMGNIAHEGGTPVRQEIAYNNARSSGCLTQQGKPYSIWEDYVTEKDNGGLTHGSCISSYSAGGNVVGIGLGFVQWTSSDRRLGYLEIMKSMNLLHYFEGDAYKEWGTISADDDFYEKLVSKNGSDADYWALWCAAIKYIRTEMDDPKKSYNGFYSVEDDVAALAEFVARVYEGCSGCAAGGASNLARQATAVQIYNDYLSGKFDAVESGTAPSATPGSNAGEDGTNVTIIGDSITVGSRSAILELLPNADVHAQDSKSFISSNGDNKGGMIIAQELKDAGTLRKNVVFALGSNNQGGVGESNIKELAENILGRGYTLYLVTNFHDTDANVYATNNKQFTQAAAVYDNVKLIDWAAAVTSAKADNPDITYITDDSYFVHPANPDGTKLFAETIYNGITGAGGSNGCDNVADPGQAISYLQQFIVDTNYLYDRNYVIPQRAEIGEHTNTPGSDESVSPNASVYQSWITQGLLKSTDGVASCWRATYCGQCTALSGWFVAMMTDYTYGGGNGIEVVGGLMSANPGGNVSDEPMAFSIFSDTGSGSAAGHTGVVLGQMDDGSWLTIENNMGNKDLMVLKRTNFAEKGGRFFDVSDKLKLDHLGKTYE